MSEFYAGDGLTILHGNALALELPEDSVDLIVTSPPYFGLRSYQDGGEHYDGQIGDEPTPAEFVDALVAATAEMIRVVKPSGSIWVNLGDRYSSGSGGQSGLAALGERLGTGGGQKADSAKNPSAPVPGMKPKSLIGVPWRYAIRCIDDLGLILRAEVIWSKPNGLPESVTDRVRRSHEQWFHFVLQPRYFSAVDEIREPHKYPHDDRSTRGSGYASEMSASINGGLNPLGKLPGSVWTIPTQPLTVPDHVGVDHFAAFPMEWPRRIITGWSPDDGVVLDPFGGTGTTALVAWALGRHGISNDLSTDYCGLAQWRCTDPGQRAAAMQVPKPEAAPEWQEALPW